MSFFDITPFTRVLFKSMSTTSVLNVFKAAETILLHKLAETAESMPSNEWPNQLVLVGA